MNWKKPLHLLFQSAGTPKTYSPIRVVFGMGAGANILHAFNNFSLGDYDAATASVLGGVVAAFFAFEPSVQKWLRENSTNSNKPHNPAP
jgi:hypothetical protein